jgi:hypothetical protein
MEIHLPVRVEKIIFSDCGDSKLIASETIQ